LGRAAGGIRFERWSAISVSNNIAAYASIDILVSIGRVFSYISASVSASARRNRICSKVFG
jgi:hypothetical protein